MWIVIGCVVGLIVAALVSETSRASSIVWLGFLFGGMLGFLWQRLLLLQEKLKDSAADLELAERDVKHVQHGLQVFSEKMVAEHRLLKQQLADLLSKPSSATVITPNPITPPVENPIEKPNLSLVIEENSVPVLPEVALPQPAAAPLSALNEAILRADRSALSLAPESTAAPAASPLPVLEKSIPLALEPVALEAVAAKPVPAEPLKSAPIAPPPVRRAPAPASRAPVTPVPETPNWLSSSIEGIKSWLFGGNPLVRIGVVLLFLGFVFLLRYVAKGIVIPIEVRYIGVAFTAIVGLVLAWRVREKRPDFALVVQGGAVALLYLTIFAALNLHPILSAPIAFSLLVCVVILAAILAVAQDALVLAVVGALGGFAAPILTSSGSGNYVGLFSYFALLNAAILGIAWFKAWRTLNLVGFFATFLIGLAWGLRAYQPADYLAVQGFLILFFLMFVGIALLFARRMMLDDPLTPQTRNLEDWRNWAAAQRFSSRYIDATLLFGVPLVGFSLQYAIVKHLPDGAAWSAMLMGAFYLLLAQGLYVLAGKSCRLLIEICLALGVIFASLAIPLALSSEWTSAAWAVEAAGIYWIGHKQYRPIARIFALCLQFGALCSFLWSLRVGGADADSLLQGAPLSALMLGLAFLFNSYFLQQTQKDLQRSQDWDARLGSLFHTLGLWSLYLLAPLLLRHEGTALSWSIAGLCCVFLGLRWNLSSWLIHASIVQLLAGAVFLASMQTGAAGSGLVNWQALALSSWIGLAALASVLFSVRVARKNNNPQLEAGMTWLMLFGLSFIVFAALFALPWATATAVWAGAGLGLLWLVMRLEIKAAFWFALGLEIFAGIAFMLSQSYTAVDNSLVAHAFTHAGFTTPLIFALAAFGAAWLLHEASNSSKRATSDDLAAGLSPLLLCWSIGWWCFAWQHELWRVSIATYAAHLFLGVMALSSLLASWIAHKRHWANLLLACAGLIPLVVLVVLRDVSQHWHPAYAWGAVAFALALLAHVCFLFRASLLKTTRFAGLLPAFHSTGAWAFILVLSLLFRHVLIDFTGEATAWRWFGWALPLLAWLVWSAGSVPKIKLDVLYKQSITLPLVLILLTWVGFSALFSRGNPAPLPYLPLFNPLELMQLFIVCATFLWLKNSRPAGITAGFAPLLPRVLYAHLFLIYTCMVLRSNHYFSGVDYQFSALFASMTAQASISIAWSVCALGCVIRGHRQASRQLWWMGAALFGVVVAKMFFIEMKNTNDLARIISFLAVAIICVIAGYFAPLPPKNREENEERP